MSYDIINPYAGSVYIPENSINILTLLSTNSWGMNTSALYYNPSNEIPDEKIIKSMGSNFYFKNFFEAGNSPDINLTFAAINKFLKNKEAGFVDNLIIEDGMYRFMSDPNLKHFGTLMGEVSLIEDRYLCVINFLKFMMQENSNNPFTPYDLPYMNLGIKNFFKEFTHFIKIIPKSRYTTDYKDLGLKIKEILLEDSKVKSMSHWDLYTFQKYYLSFSINEDFLDVPYIKLYTRDAAEAASLSFNLMDKEYVEII